MRGQRMKREWKKKIRFKMAFQQNYHSCCILLKKYVEYLEL